MLNVFEVFGKITLDSREYDDSIEDATKKANVFAGVLSANLATKAIGLAIDGLKKLGDTAVGVFKEAMDGYANYQQLVGGVETLFKDSADTVKQYAEDAYKTAGISANEYMQLVTSFSGALIKSTGRGAQTDIDALEKTLDDEMLVTKRYLEDQYDEYKKSWDKKIELAGKDTTLKKKLQEQRDEALKDLKRANEDELNAIKASNKEKIAEAEEYNNKSVSNAESLQRAAELSQIAIVDMADIANKYGKTVAEVSTTYTSLARGIYTTLDNLFGGMFAGTKQGLQELLDYAENYRAGLGETVSYSMDSYADIVSAIHDVSESLGVAETTQDEAEGTITGSLARVKASWHNLVAALGDENADIEKLLDDLHESCETAWENIKPVAKRVLDGMIELTYEFLPKFADLGLDIGWEIIKGILKALASLVLKPAAWILNATGIADWMGAGETTRYRDSMSSAYIASELSSALPSTASTSSSSSSSYMPAWAQSLQTQEGMDYFRKTGEININIQGDVYDDEASMERKMRNAVRDVIDTELAYG